MKNLLHKTFWVLFFVAFATLSEAQIERDKNAENEIINYSEEFGVHLGAVTGLGLSYRHWHQNFGIQLTASPIKGDFLGNMPDNVFFLSTALTGMYSFKNTKYIRLYGYFGNHLLYQQISEWDKNLQQDVVVDEYRYNMGFGCGFEVGKMVRFTIMIGYAGYNMFKRNYSISPTGEMGVYFKLKGRN